MDSKYKQLIPFLCLALCLSACQPPGQSVGLPASATTAVPTSLPISTITATSIPILTSSVTPSAAVAAGISPTAAATQTPAPTVDATATALVLSLVATAQPLLLKAYASPDGQWRVEVLAYPCTKVIPGEEQENAYEVLRVARLGDQQVFTARTQVFTARTQLQNCGGLGAFGLGGIQWSPDSRYFYFTDAREGVPDGGDIYGWYRNIFRFDTVTTQADYLGGGPFSADGKRLAVVRLQLEGGCRPGGLTIMDISGQVVADYPFDVPAEKCGQAFVSWSPDGKALAYTFSVCSTSGTDCQSALYRVDLTNGTPERRALLENQPEQFVNIAWNTPDRLELWSIDSRWFYNLATGQLERQP